MPLDRAARLRQAETLLRQGKLEQAIEECLRLVEDQPGDWNAANLLGDIYVGAGEVDKAIEQYSLVAASLRRDGFLPKAAALYKKIIKLRPDSAETLLQAGELAAEQGLVADARALLGAAAAAGRAHGDRTRALEAVVRLGRLDRHDVTARLAGARARHDLDDVPGALAELIDLATMLIDEQREHDALVPLREAAALDPANLKVSRALVRILLDEGRTADASIYLTPDAIIADSTLTLLAARVRLDQGDDDAGCALLEELLTRDRQSRPDVAALVDSLVPAKPDLAFRVIDRLVSLELHENHAEAAAEYLRAFIGRMPTHVPALARLAELSIEPPVPDAFANAEAPPADEPVGATGPEAAPEPPPEPPPARPNPHAIDLSLVFGTPTAPPAGPTPTTAAAGEASPPAPPSDRDVPSPVAPAQGRGPIDLERVFAEFREEAAHRPFEEAADDAFTRGTAMVDANEWQEAAVHLRAAARSPRRRFAAALLLADVHERLGRVETAIEWLGHAADAPGVTPSQRSDTLLRLADLLERTGESVRALAVCLELQADAGDDTDLAARIARLSRA